MMTTDNYIIFGVGAYVSVLDDILCDIYKQRNKCYKIEGFIDSDINKINKSYYGYGVLGSIKFIENISENTNGVIFITNGKRELIKNIHQVKFINFPNIIHPSATISKSANIGHGNIIGQNVIISSNVVIGNFNHINYSVSIGHDCKIGDYNTIYGSSGIYGSAKIQNSVFVGAGSIVVGQIVVNDNSKISAGSIVQQDIPENVLVMGNPGRIIKKIE